MEVRHQSKLRDLFEDVEINGVACIEMERLLIWMGRTRTSKKFWLDIQEHWNRYFQDSDFEENEIPQLGAAWWTSIGKVAFIWFSDDVKSDPSFRPLSELGSSGTERKSKRKSQ